MKKNARYTGLAGIGIVALLAAGCTPVTSSGENGSEPRTLEDNFGTEADPATAQQGGELVFGLSAEGDALDPTVSTSLVNQHVFASMCASLYDYAEDGSAVPHLATDLPQISADETVYTIQLRDDAVFSDGEPMTADDVVSTFERNLEDPESQRRAELGPVESVEATGEHEVTITLSEPFAPLVAALADRPGMVQNPAAVEEGFGSAPSCVAPFRFVERVANTSITVEKDPNYFDADSVYLDRIVYRIMPDANVLAANLESGDIHATDRVSPQDIDGLLNSDRVEVLSSESVGYQGLHINLDEETSGNAELATNEDVRRALAMAIDRDSVAKAASNGVWSGACGPIAPVSLYSSEAAQECPPYDPEGARELLEQAGVEVPFTIELLVTNRQDDQRYAQALQSSVQDAGFTIEVNTAEYATVLGDAANRDFDAMLLGWGGRADPDGNMRQYWTTGATTNYSSYSNPAVDELMTSATHTTDEDARAQLYAEAIAAINQDLPYVFTHRLRNLAGANGVAGVRMDVVGIVDPSRAAFVE